MHLNALLDVDVVAVENDDELSLLLELEAPQSEGQIARPPRTLQIVLDRSGSMGGGQLEAAQRALLELVGRLDPQDRFGLVTFDGQVDVVVPSGPIGDGIAARHAIASVYPRGTTNLSAGLIRGIEEARRTKGDGGATILLLSDGHANRGQTDADVLGGYAGGVRRDGMTIGSIGIGLHYDEALLSAVAAGGAGNVHFAAEPDAIGGALAAEVDGLLDQVVQAVSLRVTPGDAVKTVTLFNDLPVSPSDFGFVVELGDFAAGETRKLVLSAIVPAMADLGLAEVCRLKLQWTDVATMTTQTVDVPVYVGVVPGDQAAGRIARPEVRTEFEYQKAQRSRKSAAEALRRGDRSGAADLLRQAGEGLADFAASMPAAAPGIDALIEEAGLLGRNADEAEWQEAALSAKRNEADFHLKSRKRQAMEEHERQVREADERRYGQSGRPDAGDGKFG